jgi:hypothetical protein
MLHIKIKRAFFQYKRVSKARNDNKATKNAMQHKIKPKKSIDRTNKKLFEYTVEFKYKSDPIKFNLLVSLMRIL